MTMELPQRKYTRLIGYNYSTPGAYFVTICTQSRKPILSKINVGTPVPTDNEFNNRSSIIAKFVSTFKRFCNKEYGHNIWQERYFDHIVRNQADYAETWKYIDDNPAKWLRQHNK